MKRFCLSVSAVAAMLLAGACQQELNPVTDGDTTVTFTVNAGDVATRAIADGTNIDVLHWEIYKTDDVESATQPLGEGNISDKDGNKEFTVELKLLADQKYTIIFWAEVDGADHYITTDLRNVAIKDYDDEKANDESRAAFFRVYPFETENGETITETIELYRPFSQINLGSTTYETSFNNVNGGNVKVETSEMTVTKIATSFNTLTGKGEGEQVVTFKANATPNASADDTQKLLEVNDLYYYWIGMNYLIVCGDSDNVDVDITLDTNFGEVKHTISSVPVKENFRTNLLGNFLTTDATFTVVVDEEFQKPDEIVPVPGEDGNGSSSTYTVATVADLVWLQQQVSNGNTFSGKTVKLTSDLDLGGMEWTPIDGFKGTFDGSKGTKAADDNYTISNFTVNVNECGGLFGSVNGKILNVNVENATVTSNHYAGALVGYAYGRIENCHAENVTVTTEPELINGKYDNGDKAGAIVGYICGEPMSYLLNCSATNSTVTAYRDLGAVAGCISGTMTVEGNTAKNCKVVLDQVIDGEYGGSSTANANPVVGRNQTINITAEEFEAINNAAEDVDNKATTTPSEEEGNTLADLVKVDGAVVEVPAGEYEKLGSMGKGVTIIGTEGTVFVGSSSVGENAYIKNVKFSNSATTGNDYQTTALTGSLTNVVFEGCEFESKKAGTRYCYAYGDVVFNDCTFGSPETLRGVHFDAGDGTVTFNNCTLYGFQAFGSSLPKVTFNDCDFLSGSNSDYNCVNMYKVFEYNDCSFIPGYHCDCATNGVVADFNNCSYTDGSSLLSLVRYDKDPDTCTIRYNGLEHVAEGVGLNINGEYELLSKEGLLWLANEVNVINNSFSGMTVKLTANIDLAGIDWEPIGQTGNCTFNGIFDGQDFTISNLSVDSEDQTGANYSSGLFGWVESHTSGRGHLKNVKINGATVKGHHNCGALVGYITQQTALVENCHVTGAAISCTYANGDADGDKAGALIGNATAATPVKDCTAANSTVSAGRDAGQVTGAGKEANVTGCSATDVTVTANGTGTGANVRNEVIGRLL